MATPTTRKDMAERRLATAVRTVKRTNREQWLRLPLKGTIGVRIHLTLSIDGTVYAQVFAGDSNGPWQSPSAQLGWRDVIRVMLEFTD